MRPRGRGDDVDQDEDESSPQRSAPEVESEPEPEPEPAQPPPPQPARPPLSSLVVRPPPQENGASPAAAGRSSSSPAGDSPGRRRGFSLPRRRRDVSLPDPRGRERRRSPPPPARRRPGSPPPQRRRFSPPVFQPRHPRFHAEPQGYGMHAGPSPPRQRRLESSNFYDAIGPHYTQGYQGSGRGGARFQDGSPPYGRGGRSYGRGHSAPGKEFINIDGEYVHRNDPNLSPREGDWICQNPNCGNLNFARRTHCNNCNKYRYESSHSPHRGYFNSSPRGSPRILGLPSDRAPRREIGRYRSPPRGWGAGNPRGYAARSPPDRARRFPDPLQRGRMGLRGDRELRDHVKFQWSSEEYNQRERPHDGMYLDRCRRRSGSPWGNWGRDMQDRSRSPADNRPMKSSFTGRGRPDLDYAGPYVARGRDMQDRSRSPADNRPMKSSFTGRGRPDLDYAGPYVDRGRPNNLDAGRGRGRGYRPGGDPYPSEGRGDRRAALHDRSEGRY